MKKSVCKLISTAIACIFAFSLTTGCAKKVPDTEDTLEIYIQELGYGKQWLYDAIELFKQEDWVKEKYPNLNIPEPNYNASYGYGNTLIKSGTTTTDLIFTIAFLLSSSMRINLYPVCANSISLNIGSLTVKSRIE